MSTGNLLIRWRRVAALAVLASTIGSLPGAASAPSGLHKPDDTQSARGPEVPLATQRDVEGTASIQPLATTMNGGPIVAVSTVRESVASSSTSTSFVDIPGAVTSLTVPAGQSALFIATFSAESACSGASGWCSVRLMISGPSGTFEMLPASGSDFAFDSSDNGTETAASWESHSVQRSFSVGSGTWTIRAQRMVTSSRITFRLDDWVLRVDRASR